MTARRALAFVIAASTALRIFWAAQIGPGHDEAYYLAYSHHLDWSYYDHPPIVAWLVAATRFLTGTGATLLGARIAFILLFSGATLVLARLTSRFFDPWAGVAAALLFTLSGYQPLAAGTFALPDGPLIFFWILTLDRLAVALTAPAARRGSLWPWTLVGLAWGGALLSKYQALVLPLATLVFLLREPTARPWLRRPGPYLALAIGLLLFAPVLGWNAAHGWASFQFHGARSVEHGLWPNPLMLLIAILGQTAYLLPWIWLILFKQLRPHLNPRNRLASSASERFFLTHTLVPLAVFLVPACFRAFLPHWSLPAWLAAFPLAGCWIARQAETRPRTIRRALVAMTSVLLLAVAALTLHSHQGLFQQARLGATCLLPPTSDPTVDTSGWRETVAELERRGLLTQPNGFIFTSRWFHSGQLAAALPARTPVRCFNPGNAHAFSHWSEPESTVGRNGLLVVVDESSTEPAVYDRWFEQILPAGEFTILRAGVSIRRIQLFHCLNQKTPFPLLHSSLLPDPSKPATAPPQLASQHPAQSSASPPPTRTR